MAGASAASTSSSKVSMFGKKSGFVIPKNKLSGSLVPIFRGNKKLGGGDTTSEESGKQGQRKTKWGPDLTQDAAVRRARSLAYQTRVDQITKQLGSGILEIDENVESLSAAEQSGERSSDNVLDRESTKLLALEKREAIGEILKLNANFKAPPDYKPLLKEDRVLIPVKEYPGYNFIGLIFGPGGDNRKRLEKETGAKIQVYAVKSGTRDKGEIISADGNDFQGSFEEINVHVSADTFEKVDAAVSVIELLVTSVSGNLAPASTTSASSPAESKNVPSYANSSSMDTVPVSSQGHIEDFMGPSQTSQQVQFQYSNPWFGNTPHNAPANQFPGFIPSPNTSAPILNSPGHPMPSLFGARPASVAGFNSLSQNPSLLPPRQNPSSQYMQNSVMMHPSGIGLPPRNFHSFPQASSPAPPVHSAPIPFSVSQSLQTRPPPIPSFPQLKANATAGPQSDWPILPAGGPSNMMQVGPPPAPSINLQPNIASSAPITNASAGSTSMITGPTYPSGQSTPHSMAMSGSRPAGVPMLSSMPPPMPIQSANNTQGALPPRVTMNPFPGSLSSGSPALSFQSGPSTFTGNIPNFTPIRSPANAAPSPHRPNFGDFTFQPQQQQASQTFSGPGIQTPVPQPNSFRPAIHDPQSITPVLLRPSMGTQTARPQGGPSPIPFPGDSSRFPSFPVVGPTPVPQMRPRNMNPAAQLPDLAGSFPSRPGNPIEVQRAFHGQMNQPPRHHFIHGPSAFPGRPALGPGGRQIYDPFSPTSTANAPQQHGVNPAIVKRQENDPEYEDLMASVGVK
ncbi:splicing factor 1 isoform X2 [Eucalyptus grandis]|nr:splicing factor 1 isoform X2 [Eucalyptus grandis]